MRRRGVALLNVLMFTMLSAMFLIAASRFVADSLREGRRTRNDQQVYNVAKAGILEALSWLRKQPDKPVAHFDPMDNVLPAGTNTLDQQIGLVKEWCIDDNRKLWARFEVGRDPEAPVRTGVAAKGSTNTTLYPSGTFPKFWYNYNDGSTTYGVLDWGAQDISTQRGRPSKGMTWLLRSRGYTFQRTTAAASGITSEPFSLGNAALRPIQAIEIEAEVTLPEIHPRQACVYAFDDPADGTSITAHSANNCNATGSQISIHGVSGAAPQPQVDVYPKDGLAYNIWTSIPQSKLDLAAEGGGRLSGPSLYGMGSQTLSSGATNPNYVSSTIGDQVQATFGVGDLKSLRGLADFVYDKTNPPPAQPTKLPQMAIIYIDAKDLQGVGQNDVTFDGTGTNPTLSGGGILVVEGALNIDGKNVAQSWDGLIFTTLAYRQFAGTRITGGVITGKHVIVHGGDTAGGGPAHLNYSASTLNSVIRQVNNYREQRSTMTIVPNSLQYIF